MNDLLNIPPNFSKGEIFVTSMKTSLNKLKLITKGQKDRFALFLIVKLTLKRDKI